MEGGRGLHAETAQSVVTVIFKLVIGGLLSIILVVFGTVNLQFQGHFVPMSSRPVLGIVAAYVMAIVWFGRHVANFFSTWWVFQYLQEAHRIWLRILSIALEKEIKILDFA